LPQIQQSAGNNKVLIETPLTDRCSKVFSYIFFAVYRKSNGWDKLLEETFQGNAMDHHLVIMPMPIQLSTITQPQQIPLKSRGFQNSNNAYDHYQ